MNQIIRRAVLGEGIPIMTKSDTASVMELYESMLPFEFEVFGHFSRDIEMQSLFYKQPGEKINPWERPMVVSVDKCTTRPVITMAGVH